ncbi:MAG: hypothetical protein ACUVXD_17605 [Thermodesulfobacteriota bacterium]
MAEGTSLLIPLGHATHTVAEASGIGDARSAIARVAEEVSAFERMMGATRVAPEGEMTVGLVPGGDHRIRNKGFLYHFASNGIQPVSFRSLQAQMAAYKEDQLLAHPGGDGIDVDAAEPRVGIESGEGFLQRVGKDLRDALANVVNLFQDLLTGSRYRYVNEDGRVETAQRKGLLGSIGEFFKDLASGLSLGHFRPDGEPEPIGIVKRVGFAFNKIFGEAIMDDLVFGVPSATLNLVDDAALAAWNLLEVVPDATVGTLPGGQEVVTTVFDNGQVFIDYLTDCLPAGDAWMRVHAYAWDEGGIAPPILYNIQLPERFSVDSRWHTVRNTPFRKAIETLGSLLADVWLARFTTQGLKTSKRRQ